MKSLYTALLTELDAGRDSVLVTIIASSGSTPRGAGARMLARADGSFVGTVGGGAVEHAAQQKALELMALRQDSFQGYDLSANDVAQLGMVCGGRVTVCFRFIPGGDAHMRELCCRALKLLEGNRDAWTITDITGERVGAMGLYTREEGLWGMELPEAEALVSGKAYPVQLGEKRYYCEPLLKAGLVYVFGGGHVSRELVPALSRAGFRCVVYDDRPEFVTPELFPDALERICGDFGNISAGVEITAADYVVIMSRGHQYDYLLQAQALRTAARYVGVIGSRKKRAAVEEKLLADGFAPETIARCISPIGLDIGAETPAEIAVSITAQLIQVRAGKK